MNEVRLGVIGCGVMGQIHLKALQEVRRLKVTAVSDSSPANLGKAAETYGARGFAKAEELIASDLVDAVIIATPHYFHPPYAIAALERGLHVLTEKPVAVSAKAAEAVNRVADRHPHLRFAAMFQMRTVPQWVKIREILASGRLGALQRLHWTATAWFRSQAYYNSGGWRATWEGEGGGVLLNQCPHNLDLLCWLAGSPRRVRAHVALGKYHRIEVEDQVTAYLEYENGATGTFIASTGEGPGTDYLEIVGDRGRIILPGRSGGNFELLETSVSVREYSNATDVVWGFPPATVSEVKTPQGGGHKAIHENFVASILDGTPLIAPAREGLASVELANAMIYSGLKDQWVELPMDREGYEALLGELIEESRRRRE